jgi:hypothetical protein
VLTLERRYGDEGLEGEGSKVKILNRRADLLYFCLFILPLGLFVWRTCYILYKDIIIEINILISEQLSRQSESNADTHY